MTSSLQGAGRELDQRIAIEVMGWIGVVPEHVEAGGTRWFVPSGKPSLPRRRIQVPFYSADIAAAFHVVEKMRTTDGGDYEQFWIFIDCCDLGWRAELWCAPTQGDAPVKISEAAAETLSLAICQCALASVSLTDKET